MEQDKKTNEELMSDIMSDINSESSQEDAVETTTEETSTTQTQVEEEVAESSETTEITSEPESNNEVNKIEGFKALRAKIKEQEDFIKALQGKESEKEAEVKTNAESALEEFAELFDKSKEDIQAAMLAKKAEKQGLTPEAMKRFDELQAELETFKAQSKKSEEAKADAALADSIDKLIEYTKISDETKLKKFFELAKDEYDYDFINKPNLKAMKALWDGGLGKKHFKSEVEQQALLDIKNGANVDLGDSNTDSIQATKQKQENKKFEAAYEKWAAIASKR